MDEKRWKKIAERFPKIVKEAQREVSVHLGPGLPKRCLRSAYTQVNTYSGNGSKNKLTKEVKMMEHYLQLLFSKASLTCEEAESAMDAVMKSGNPCQIAAFLSVLKYRKETAEEVAGMVKAVEKNAVRVQFSDPVLDIVGTGGDRANTVNISTGAAILAAACGIPIAKHGGRSVSSRSGSADVLEALGVDIEMPPEMLADCLKETSIAFMFAPLYHPCLKRLSTIRKELKLPTVFNILGPLLNPAKAEYALIGVSSEPLLELVSRVILNLNNKKRVLVFHGSGLDELTPLGPAIAYDIYGGQMHRFEIDPTAIEIPRCALKDLQGGDARTNSAILREVLAGKPGPIADSLALTAGAALWIFNRTDSLREGLQLASRTLRAGAALQTLEKWKIFRRDR